MPQRLGGATSIAKSNSKVLIAEARAREAEAKRDSNELARKDTPKPSDED
jgi:hypothetical protein